MSLKIIIFIISLIFATISVIFGKKKKKSIRSWTFWRSTGCVLIIVAWTISAVFSLDYDNFKINYIGILAATIMVALIGKQTYGGEEKNSGEIAVKKDKIINAYSLICMAVCFVGFVMNVPWE